MFGKNFLMSAMVAAASALVATAQDSACTCPVRGCTAPLEAWGPLSGYNLVALNDLSAGAAEIEGPVAVGGTFKVVTTTGAQGGIGHMLYCEPGEFNNNCPASLTNVASSLALGSRTCSELAKDSKVTNGLTVAGAIQNYKSGRVQMGHILVSTAIKEANDLDSHLPNAADTGCQVIGDGSLFTLFDDLRAKASELVAYYTSLPASGMAPAAVNSGFLQLRPRATVASEVITIDPSLVGSARQVTFFTEPNTQSGQLVIIVPGTGSVRMPAAAENARVHNMASRTIWVFPDATEVVMNVPSVGSPHVGHILAPKATIKKSGQGMYIGRAVARNIEILTQVNYLVDNIAPVCKVSQRTCVQFA